MKAIIVPVWVLLSLSTACTTKHTNKEPKTGVSNVTDSNPNPVDTRDVTTDETKTSVEERPENSSQTKSPTEATTSAAKKSAINTNSQKPAPSPIAPTPSPLPSPKLDKPKVADNTAFQGGASQGQTDNLKAVNPPNASKPISPTGSGSKKVTKVPAQATKQAPKPIQNQSAAPVRAKTEGALNISEQQITNLPVKLKCLFAAYPGEFKLGDDLNSIVFKDKTVMKYESKVQDLFDATVIANPGLSAMMAWTYPTNEAAKGKWNYRTTDPGRNRHDPFFFKLYGSSEAEVEKQVVTIIWKPTGIESKVHTKFGLPQKYEAIGKELDSMIKSGQVTQTEVTKYLTRNEGTFVFRKIACSSKQSNHSFGASIDLLGRSTSNQYAAYWKWRVKVDCKDSDSAEKRNQITRDAMVRFKNSKYNPQSPSMPLKVVALFEKYGFIWGGNWKHIDTMHFEYRPELLLSDVQCDAGFRDELKKWRGLK